MHDCPTLISLERALERWPPNPHICSRRTVPFSLAERNEPASLRFVSLAEASLQPDGEWMRSHSLQGSPLVPFPTIDPGVEKPRGIDEAIVP